MTYMKNIYSKVMEINIAVENSDLFFEIVSRKHKVFWVK